MVARLTSKFVASKVLVRFPDEKSCVWPFASAYITAFPNKV